MINDPLVTVVVTPRERYSVVRRTLETIALHTKKIHRLVSTGPCNHGCVEAMRCSQARSSSVCLSVRPVIAPRDAASVWGVRLPWKWSSTTSPSAPASSPAAASFSASKLVSAAKWRYGLRRPPAIMRKK